MRYFEKILNNDFCFPKYLQKFHQIYFISCLAQVRGYATTQRTHENGHNLINLFKNETYRELLLIFLFSSGQCIQNLAVQEQLSSTHYSLLKENNFQEEYSRQFSFSNRFETRRSPLRKSVEHFTLTFAYFNFYIIFYSNKISRVRFKITQCLNRTTNTNIIFLYELSRYRSSDHVRSYID